MSVTSINKSTSNTYEIDPNKEYFLAGDISASMQTVDPACGGLTRFQ